MTPQGEYNAPWNVGTEAAGKCEKMAHMPRVHSLTVLFALVVVTSSAAQTPAAVATPPVVQRRPANAAAMYEFLLARRAEASEDVAGAQRALERALALEPDSAELYGELAAFHVRQDRAPEAVAAAERALALDAGSEEGHRVLGLVNAAWADGALEGPPGGTSEAWRAAAISHLTAVQASPATATDLGLQVTLARQLVAAGDAAKAVPILERVMSQTGPVGEPLTLLADAHSALGQFDRAAAVLEQAADVNPRYFMALGDFYERQGKFESAAGAFEKGVARMRTPGRELRLRLAAALLNIPGGAGAERAITAATAVLAASPKDVGALYLLAQAHRQRGDAAKATSTAREALAGEPNHTPTLLLLASIYRDQYNFDAIATLLAPVESSTPPRRDDAPGDTVRLLAELAGARQQLGDYVGGVRALERAHTLMPGSTGVAAALAQAYVQARQYDDAIRVVQAAKTRTNADVELIRLEAIAGIGAGRVSEAVASAETKLRPLRSTSEGAYALADVYRDAKRHPEAIAVLRDLATATPEDDGVAFRLGAAYETAGRVPDAERVFRAILSRDPLHASSLNYLGYMLANRGLRLQEALALVDRALAVEPGNPAFLDSRGWTLLKLGRAAEAEAPLREAARALRGSSVIQLHYAEVLAALGKRGEAAERLDLALKGDGVDVDKAALERRLRQLGRKAP